MAAIALLLPFSGGANDFQGSLTVTSGHQKRSLILQSNNVTAIGSGTYCIQCAPSVRVSDCATSDTLGFRRNTVRPVTLYPQQSPNCIREAYYFDGQVLITLKAGVNPDVFLSAQSAESWQPLKNLRCTYTLRFHQPVDALARIVSMRKRTEVVRCEPLLAKQLQRKFVFNDPWFSRQWHLINTGQLGGAPGVDLNGEGVWDHFRGKGVNVGILDDGLQSSHPDLAANIDSSLGYDFNDGDSNPDPADLDLDVHGTQVAGLVGAVGGNGLGVSGVAPDCHLVGLRLLGGPVTDELIAAALLHQKDQIAVKNSSWGGTDGTGLLESMGELTEAALAEAVKTGRGGKGTIFLFAGGNGRGLGENANYDAYVNSMYTIGVGATTHRGLATSYAEPGACLVVSAPSGSTSAARVITTDLTGLDGADSGDYTTNFTGTSASTPLVSGVVAIMLEANPALGWRDVQEVLMRSARVNDATDTDWATNSAGIHFNHKYGAGLVDLKAAVDLALIWTNLPPRISSKQDWNHPGLGIPDNTPGGVVLMFTNDLSRLRLEHVTLRVGLKHDDWGDLRISLESPSGIVSRLADVHSPALDTELDWTFMTVRHWGEKAEGVWKVTVEDRRFFNQGQLNRLQLEWHGTEDIASSPPVLRVHLGKGGLELSWVGQLGQTYTIEMSKDLRDWRSIGSLRLDQELGWFVDPELSDSMRFYRLRK